MLRTRRTFAEELDLRVEQHPDKVFMQYDDEQITFADARERSVRAANRLLALGVEPGDLVAMFTGNCAEWVDVWFAAARMGARSMPVNVMYRGDFLLHQLRDSGAKLLLVDAPLVDRVEPLLAELPELQTLLVRGGDAPPTLGGRRVLPASVLAEGDGDAPAGGTPLAWDEPAFLFYTSGTTGPSKGAVLTQHYMLTCARGLGQRYAMTGDDVMFAAVPLFHVSGAQGVVLGSLVTGRTSVLDSAFSPTGCWPRVRELDATIFFGVGAMLMMLWNLPADPSDAELPIRLLIAAPIPPELHGAVEERYGCTAVVGYGLTEAMLIACHDVSEPVVPGTAGTPGPLYDVRLVDDADDDVAVGQVGEIVVRPRAPHVMFEGYHDRPAETLAQFANLWFHTGDLGRFDEGGNLAFVDRKKDAIRRRGENISSFEVERTVLTHPAVLECAAHAVPSPLGEDDVKICVVCKPGESLAAKELMDHCVERMPVFALPRYIEFVTELPKNVVGRVQKHILRQRPVDKNTWDRDAEGYAVRK